VSASYWTRFWVDHGAKSRGDDPQSQVLRTSGGRPVTPEVVGILVGELVRLLELDRSRSLLDLCCGNGVLTAELAKSALRTFGVDLSPELIAAARERGAENLEFTVADVRAIELPRTAFDRILLYAGIQYLDEAETVALLERARQWLADGGLLVLGDVPDLRRRWSFFDSPDRRRAYFRGIASGEPIIGTWFDPDWLRHAAVYAGFEKAEILDQDPRLPYAHFRFDARLRA
jgi:cyclopropane fatty-acyl-phospholipid synthase-like methyltransferase